jgi:hypothetical protein
LTCVIQIFQLGAGQHFLQADDSFAMLIPFTLHMPAFSRRCRGLLATAQFDVFPAPNCATSGE